MKSDSTGLVVAGLEKSFGSTSALKDVSFELEKGESLALLGPSGCGKSTTLAIVAGFERPDRGRVKVLGRDITHLSPAQRNVGVVFQSYALFPHMTVEANVDFGLRVRKLDKEVRRKRILEALELVGLQNKATRYPRELSGGEQQRVALVRALVVQPDLLLLDEPLSNLDAALREGLRGEIRRIQRELDVTTVFVTHDQREAFGIGDKVAIIFDGMIRQIDIPTNLYQRPADSNIARFLGGANVLTGEVASTTKDGDVMVGVGKAAIRVPAASCSQTFRRGDTVELILRPENLRFATGRGTPGWNSVEVRVRTIEYLGGTHQVVCDVHGSIEVRVVLSGGGTVPSANMPTSLEWDPSWSWLVPSVERDTSLESVRPSESDLADV